MEYFLRFPGGRDRALTFSYDDGVDQDERVISVLKKHGLKGTFNICGDRFWPEDTPYPAGKIARRIPESKFREIYLNDAVEVAIHGFRHMRMACLPKGSAAYEIIADRKKLEDLTGRLVTGGAYANGSYNDDVIQALDTCGIDYFRTTKNTHSFLLPENWLAWHPTCHHKDPQLMSMAEDFLSRQAKVFPTVFYLWGHGYEFERDDNWEVLENFAERMAGHSNVWYATNGEICSYVKAGRALRASADGSMLHNPTAISVWLSCDGNIVEIRPGETVRLW